MKSDLDKFYTYFEKVINRVNDKKEFQKIVLECLNKYNIPVDITADLLAFRKNINEFGEKGKFVAFCVLDVIRNQGYSISLNQYYTDTELKYFAREKYNDNKDIKFPIRFKCVQVADDQYIGTIDAQTLVNLGWSDLIRYNIETQRTMRRIVRGETVQYRIAIDKNALREIKEMFRAGTYIPNTITLNIPEGEGDFYYNEKTCELVINHIDKFDITDGYHRYQALISVITENPEFNCPLELRIQNFGIDKADSFIWQEDKKTKMKKVDSESYNMNESANRVTKRINDAADSNLHGLIARSQTVVNFSWFSSCVRFCYFKKNDKKPGNINLFIIETSKKLIKYFNCLTEIDDSLLTTEWDFVDMTIWFYLSIVLNESEWISAIEIGKKVRQKLESDTNMALFFGKQMKGTIWSAINRVYDEAR